MGTSVSACCATAEFIRAQDEVQSAKILYISSQFVFYITTRTAIHDRERNKNDLDEITLIARKILGETTHNKCLSGEERNIRPSGERSTA